MGDAAGVGDSGSPGTAMATGDLPELAVKMLETGVLVSRLARSDRCGVHLSASWISILQALHAAGPLEADALTAMGMRPFGAVQDAVDELVAHGLVAREDAPGRDGGGQVRMTEAGRRIYDERQAQLAAPLVRVLEELPDDEVRLLENGIALLETLAGERPGTAAGQAGAAARPDGTPNERT